MLNFLINIACVTGIAFCILLLYAIIGTFFKTIFNDLFGNRQRKEQDELDAILLEQMIKQAVAEVQEEEKKAKKKKKSE